MFKCDYELEHELFCVLRVDGNSLALGRYWGIMLSGEF